LPSHTSHGLSVSGRERQHPPAREKCTGHNISTSHRTLQTPPAPEENGSPSYSSLRMWWAQRADAWTYSADLPQHVKSAALLAGAHCPKDQALGNTGWPEENYQLCRVPQIEGLIGHDRMQKKKNTLH
jgi:hypothetical protein